MTYAGVGERIEGLMAGVLPIASICGLYIVLLLYFGLVYLVYLGLMYLDLWDFCIVMWNGAYHKLVYKCML